ANWWSIAEVTLTCGLGIAALAAGFQGWALRRTTRVERTLLLVAGVLLAYPGWVADLAGIAGVTVAMVMQLLRRDAPVAGENRPTVT
ncbi:MAG TPA: C4-dicarboxylate ABC transporter permease, partial [Ramlibacter sp.]|nr:C4-dicarboxylate ABC transporter permease [Ramlibacter sp.]